jgi:hypothetical protein
VKVVQCKAFPAVFCRSLVIVALVVLVPRVSAANTNATLLRLFLTDGTPLVSYGEFARVEDRVIFSMPIGGTDQDPRLRVVTIPASAVDWDRTERYAASARYQHYANTRGEEDFARLSNDVARVLNEVALTTEPHKALQIAEQARRTLADWPRQHYGYRQREVREIVSLLDEAISDLRASAGVGAFDLSFVAMVADVPLQPVHGMPSRLEMVSQLLAVANLAERSAEKLTLLQSALVLANETSPATAEMTTVGRAISARIEEELEVDEKYAELSKKWLEAAADAASRARVRDVETIVARLARDDRKLGQRRPEVVQALNASMRVHLDNARRLRLLRDQWLSRRTAYRDYQKSVKAQILQLVKAQPALDAIKRLDGPPPPALESLRERLEGGADRLARTIVSDDLRAAHDLLIGAWRFAETAVRTRQDAISGADLPTAWRASSAAAAAVMTLGRVQAELRRLLEPPQLR